VNTGSVDMRSCSQPVFTGAAGRVQRPVFTGVINVNREHGCHFRRPCSRPVFTGNVYRPLGINKLIHVVDNNIPARYYYYYYYNYYTGYRGVVIGERMS